MKSSLYHSCILFFVFVLTVFSSEAQKYDVNYKEGQHIQLASGDSVVTFNTSTKKAPNYRPDRFYCWFDNRSIQCTQGYSLGKLLEGEYVITNQEGQLLQRGEFKNGLKRGSWITWYPDGYIKSVANWRNGKLIKNEKRNDPAGNLPEESPEEDPEDGEENEGKDNVWKKFKGIFKKDSTE